MQVKKQQLELDMEQQIGSKLEKECVKAVYCHIAHLTYIQRTSCKMLGWMKHKLEEISITSDIFMNFIAYIIKDVMYCSILQLFYIQCLICSPLLFHSTCSSDKLFIIWYRQKSKMQLFSSKTRHFTLCHAASKQNHL